MILYYIIIYYYIIRLSGRRELCTLSSAWPLVIVYKMVSVDIAVPSVFFVLVS